MARIKYEQCPCTAVCRGCGPAQWLDKPLQVLTADDVYSTHQTVGPCRLNAHQYKHVSHTFCTRQIARSRASTEHGKCAKCAGGRETKRVLSTAFGSGHNASERCNAYTGPMNQVAGTHRAQSDMKQHSLVAAGCGMRSGVDCVTPSELAVSVRRKCDGMNNKLKTAIPFACWWGRIATGRLFGATVFFAGQLSCTQRQIQC